MRAITNGPTVEVFGSDALGNAFCCILPPNPSQNTIISITGSTWGDAIILQYDDHSAGTSWDLESVSSHDMLATVVGARGDDDIRGSRDQSATYEEWLQGGDGDDHITGHEGDDFLYGGNGEDRLFGNEGDDWLVGGADRDTLFGNDGADTLYGDGETPHVYPARDIINGGNGDDLICSGGKTVPLSGESLWGGDGDDIIWASAAPWSPHSPVTDATIYGEADTDECDGNLGSTTSSDCETLITSDPGCW